jgi:hypothetical protein
MNIVDRRCPESVSDNEARQLGHELGSQITPVGIKELGYALNMENELFWDS